MSSEIACWLMAISFQCSGKSSSISGSASDQASTPTLTTMRFEHFQDVAERMHFFLGQRDRKLTFHCEEKFEEIERFEIHCLEGHQRERIGREPFARFLLGKLAKSFSRRHTS